MVAPLGNRKMWMNTTFRGFKTGHYAMRYMAEFYRESDKLIPIVRGRRR